MNSKDDPKLEAAQVSMFLAEHEALNGIPNFLDIPDVLRKKIEHKVIIAERMFWLRADNIQKDVVNTTLLRRAVYAEQRCNETEHMLGEMAVITEGAKEEIQRLQGELSKLAGKIE